MRYAALFILSLFLYSCEDTETLTTDDVPSIKYGTSFGMCIGHCVTDLEVTAQQIYISQYGWNNSVVPKSKTVIFQEEKYNEMLNLVNQAKFLALDPVIGCPDCADGGSEWLEVTIGSRTKKVTFEYGSEVEGINDMILKLREITSDLKQ